MHFLNVYYKHSDVGISVKSMLVWLFSFSWGLCMQGRVSQSSEAVKLWSSVDVWCVWGGTALKYRAKYTPVPIIHITDVTVQCRHTAFLVSVWWADGFLRPTLVEACCFERATRRRALMKHMATVLRALIEFSTQVVWADCVPADRPDGLSTPPIFKQLSLLSSPLSSFPFSLPPNTFHFSPLSSLSHLVAVDMDSLWVCVCVCMCMHECVCVCMCMFAFGYGL